MHRAKRLILLIYFSNVLLALIPMLFVEESIQSSLGPSRAGDHLARGFDPAWYAEFRTAATGLASTFDATLLSAGALLKGLEAFLNGQLFKTSAGITLIGLLYALIWTWWSGAFLSVYILQAPLSRDQMLSASARFFPLFLRLAILSGIFYFLIYAYLLPRLTEFTSQQTRNLVDERVVFLWASGKWLVILLCLATIGVWFDYAKIVAVIQSRRSAALALIQALGLAMRNPGRVALLYLSLTLIGLLFLWFYSFLPTKPWEQTWRGMTATFAAGQFYILSRIWVRLLSYSSQAALVHSFLANEMRSEPGVPATVTFRQETAMR
ncbi:MAG: hypothetical protein HY645_01540 [Acidobacteria bacterium]|nr:hypothetical protein [Acidobacteriota bacterium]